MLQRLLQESDFSFRTGEKLIKEVPAASHIPERGCQAVVESLGELPSCEIRFNEPDELLGKWAFVLAFSQIVGVNLSAVKSQMLPKMVVSPMRDDPPWYS
jgi:hypothetical protein